MTEDLLPEDDSISTVLPVSLDDDAEYDGPCCEKCGAPITTHESLVCRKCGWYASIGSYVEIDKSWEVATDPGLEAEEEALPQEKAKLPTWAWILTGCIVAVVVESVAVRVLTPSGSSLRTVWSLSQLAIGFVAFGVCHTYAYVLVMRDEADVKLMDYLLRPIKTWSSVIRELPLRSWVCYYGLSGLVAAAMAMLVIGGIPYERLLDWGVKEKANSSLMGAIMEQAQGGAKDDDKTLEEAVEDFAGEAGVDGEAKKPVVPKKPERQNKDCIIIGFMTNQAGDVKNVLLAADHFGKLRYAGNVQLGDLPEEAQQSLKGKPICQSNCQAIRKRIDRRGSLGQAKVPLPRELPSSR